MVRYTILGVEHVYDAFDEYEHPNDLPPLTVLADSPEDAVAKGTRAFQDVVTETRRRGGFLSSGSFTAEVVQIRDARGEVVYQGRTEHKITWGGQVETYNLLPLTTTVAHALESELIEEYRWTFRGREFREGRILLPTDLRLIQFLDGHPETVDGLTPRQFEELVAELLSRFGYEVSLSPKGRDDGIDIYAEATRDTGLELVLVQCKKYARDRKVARSVVKQLSADLADRKATRGLLVTTSYFTRPALDYFDQAKYRLTGIDFDKLQEWLRKLRADHRGT